MKAFYSLVAVLALVIIAIAGVKLMHFQILFGVIIPYLAFACFMAGFVYRILTWAQSPVPFRIPVTCGQQQSLPWIKQDKLENPSSTMGVVARMALEVLFFRSLFRNVKTELRTGERGARLAYGSSKWLWLGALAFHWSLLVILLRHIRLFTPQEPGIIRLLAGLDGFLQIGVPMLYLTDMFLLSGLLFLLLRRFLIPRVRYVSLTADYFPLFLIIGIALSGIIMRYFLRVDLVEVKYVATGLARLQPALPEGIGTIFYVHLFLISMLFAYFPWSKLMHMGGIFLSPTRNLINNSRQVRHINPWNYPVAVHTYAEYEDDFRAKMKKAGVPVERE